MMSQLWRSRKRRKASKGKSEKVGQSQKPGCKTGPLKKFFFCNTKAWRHPQYNVWHEKAKIMNGVSTKKAA